jgi:hypothetical protein
VTVCSLLWAVTGVSVLAIAVHEYHHHHAETHNHQDAFELVLHCHDNEGSPHHDHELNASMSASRTSWSGHLHSMVSQANDLLDSEVGTRREAGMVSTVSNDHGPPVFLLHCVLLT